MSRDGPYTYMHMLARMQCQVCCLRPRQAACTSVAEPVTLTSQIWGSVASGWTHWPLPLHWPPIFVQPQNPSAPQKLHCGSPHCSSDKQFCSHIKDDFFMHSCWRNCLTVSGLLERGLEVFSRSTTKACQDTWPDFHSREQNCPQTLDGSGRALMALSRCCRSCNAECCTNRIACNTSEKIEIAEVSLRQSPSHVLSSKSLRQAAVASSA
jgi:hypothetical protein